MIICYEDITLKAIEEDDLDLLQEMLNDPEIENMTAGVNLPVSKVQQKIWYNKWIQSERNNEIRLMINVPEHGNIGTVILTDIDYRNSTAQFHLKIAASKSIYGKGYGTKAAKALIKYAFEQLNLNCIYSRIIDYNEASQRVHEKCGFKKEGILRDRIYKNGKYHNIVVWSITRDDFLHSRTARSD